MKTSENAKMVNILDSLDMDEMLCMDGMLWLVNNLVKSVDLSDWHLGLYDEVMDSKNEENYHRKNEENYPHVVESVYMDAIRRSIFRVNQPRSARATCVYNGHLITIRTYHLQCHDLNNYRHCKPVYFPDAESISIEIDGSLIFELEHCEPYYIIDLFDHSDAIVRGFIHNIMYDDYIDRIELPAAVMLDTAKYTYQIHNSEYGDDTKDITLSPTPFGLPITFRGKHLSVAGSAFDIYQNSTDYKYIVHRDRRVDVTFEVFESFDDAKAYVDAN